MSFLKLWGKKESTEFLERDDDGDDDDDEDGDNDPVLFCVVFLSRSLSFSLGVVGTDKQTDR